MSKVKCIHNPCDERNTLVKLSTRQMVQPSKIFYRCKVCNKVFPLTEADFGTKAKEKNKLLSFLKKHLFFKEGGN